VAADPAAAARAARGADVAIVVVGEGPYAEGLGNTQTAALSDDQRALAQAVEATGTPVVLVVIAGRPLIITDLLPSARALLMAYLPGTEGGHAVADALFGAINPSGRLPVSWPRAMGQEPLFYTFLPGTTFGTGSTYDPLFPFGYGLGYTTFAQESLRVDPSVGRQGTAHLAVTVRNTGRRAGDDVVQVYVHPEDSAVVVPPRRLVAFARVHLRAGEARTVTLALPASRLAAVPGDIPAGGQPVVAPGRYTIMSGDQSATLTVR
jgi:beta-glucosidase